jgi:rhodanese-related sulfurtransferase
MIRSVAGFAGRRTLEALLEDARSRIERLEAARAWEATRSGAVLVDIRSERNRVRDGIVPGSLHLPRTVLEWRLDPDSPWRSPYAPSLDRQVVLVCDHGCSSILAAATLVELGFSRAGDVIGGFAAWRAAGLPVVPAPAPADEPDEPAGMRAPDPVR